MNRMYILMGLFAICVVCFLSLIVIHSIEKEVYIQEEPQITKNIRKNNDVYIDVYRAPCKDNELIECIYMRIYPSMIEELERDERSKTDDRP